MMSDFFLAKTFEDPKKSFHTDQRYFIGETRSSLGSSMPGVRVWASYG